MNTNPHADIPTDTTPSTWQVPSVSELREWFGDERAIEMLNLPLFAACEADGKLKMVRLVDLLEDAAIETESERDTPSEPIPTPLDPAAPRASNPSPDLASRSTR